MVGFVVAPDRAVQPGLGIGPIAVGSSPGDPENVGSVLNRQPGEVAQLDQFRLFGILVSQPVYRPVQAKEFIVRLNGASGSLVQVDTLKGTSVLETALAPSVFDENPPHGLCRRSEKVPPAVPMLSLFDVHDPDV